MRARCRPVVAVAATLTAAMLVVLYANGGGGGGGPTTASRNGSRVTGGDRRSVSVWVSVTKVDRGRLLAKFRKFFGSLVGRLGRCRAAVQLNVIADNASRAAVDGVVSEFAALHRAETRLTLVHYDLRRVLDRVAGKIEPLKRFFRSSEGSYYSDDVFYLSPALHLVAPDTLDKAIVMDVDTEFRSSVCGLYDAFDNFTGTQLFGMAPELSPVYHHALWKWRNYRRDEYENRKRADLNGLNSGVIMLYLGRIRKNAEYERLVSAQWISAAIQKYMFKGHLGDQDWYTLVSYERPELIYRLSCGWNRQLCTWWKQHGYADTFDSFAECTEQVHLYHGNCDTPIAPK